jgi:HPt (histidine-containing phosphotransfer) domain-containing protein
MSKNETIHIDVNQVSSELRIRPEIYMKILSSFTTTLQERVKLLYEALQKNDHEGMRRILHEIKGTAGNLRLTNISNAQDVLHIAVKAQESYDKLLLYTEGLKVESEKLYQYVQQLTKTQKL